LLIPNISCSISGAPKTGKTHLALTFPPPIAVFSFDLRGAELLLPPYKTFFEGKEVVVKQYLPPITDSTKPDNSIVKLWSAIKADYRETVESGKFATIIIDPATMLWEIIRHSWQVEEGRNTVGVARNYGEPNARMTWMITTPLVAGLNVITTQYLKDVYVNDQPTGEKALDGFKRTEGLADVALWTQKATRQASPDERRSQGTNLVNVVKTNITDCRFDRKLNGLELIDTTYNELMAMMGLSE